MKTNGRSQSHDYRGQRSHDSAKIASSDLDLEILNRPRVAPRSLKARLNLERLMSLKQSTVCLCARAFDGDRVDPSTCNRRVSVDPIASDDLHVATYPSRGPITCQPEDLLGPQRRPCGLAWPRVASPRVRPASRQLHGSREIN